MSMHSLVEKEDRAGRPVTGGLLSGPPAVDATGPLLTGSGTDHAAHRRTHGPVPAPDGRTLADLLEASGLTGRGGAAFPVHRKLRTALTARRRPRVVVNGGEGEPLSAKDRVLLTVNPHLVLDGALLTAAAVHAVEVVAVVPADLVDHVSRAVAARPDASAVRIVPAGGGFTGGEASAVASRVTGGPGLPLDRTVPLAVAGPGRRPVFLSNAETVAAVALVARYGPGGAGTRLFTVTGDVAVPCVTELPCGTGTVTDTVTDVATAVGRAGGAGHGSVALVGGFSGGWVQEEDWSVPFTDTAGVSGGVRPGVGIIHVVGPSRCPVSLAADIVTWLAGQSAGQCGPCVHGLPALARAFGRMAAGDPDPELPGRVRALSGLVVDRGLCRHPDGAAAFVAATLAAFPEEFARHRGHRCGRVEQW